MVDVPHRDHAPGRHIGEQRDFFALFIRDAAVGTAQQHIGLDADFAQLLRSVLSGFGLQLAGRGNPRHIGQVHEGGLVGPELQAHLAHRFEERQRLDVADRAADLDDGDIDRMVGVAIGCDAGAALDEFLDLVGDVRDHLHRLAEVVAAAFSLEHTLVDLAGGEVVGLLHPSGDEALVVAQVEIGFRAVVGHIDLAVLEWRHRAGVDIEVGVELDQRDLDAARFKDRCERRRRNALAQRGHHTAGDKDVLGHCFQQRICTLLWWEKVIIGGAF